MEKDMEKRLSVEAFPKLQFWGDKLRLPGNLEIRGFVRMKAGSPKASKTAIACPKKVRVSVQSISFGTGSVL
ncbi:MAG: hypothetical protein LBO04_00475 [Spirochaetaceae bacterium]|nr:hypothetical protein [Spirochaetaceae bacterium]